jgi:hypothetical protein
VRREDTPLRGVDKPLRGLCDFGEHTRTARCVKSEDMPLRGMSSARHVFAHHCALLPRHLRLGVCRDIYA